MPIFEVQHTDGKTYEVDAPSQEALMSAIAGLPQSGPKPLELRSSGPAERALDGLTFGFGPKIVDAAVTPILAAKYGKGWGETYDALRAAGKASDEQYTTENPKTALAATLAGGLVGGVGAARAGAAALGAVAPNATAALNATRAGRWAGDVASGAGMGALDALGHGQDVTEGALTGGVIGGAARPLVSGVTSAGRGAFDAVAALLGKGNAARAEKMVADAAMGGDKSAEDVTNLLKSAYSDQSGFALVDALGDRGARLLNGIVRRGGDAGTAAAEQLATRQAGQRERLANIISEGFGTQNTAKLQKSLQEAERRLSANELYGAARQEAGAVDVSPALDIVSDYMKTAAPWWRPQPTSAIEGTSIGSAMKKARGLLTDGETSLNDFDRVLTAKKEISAMMEGATPSVQKELKPLLNSLDEQLALSSKPYAEARNTYRAQSKAIEAIDRGGAAAKDANRYADTLAEFKGLGSDAERQGFRAGYGNDILRRIEAGPMTATSDATRMLQTPKRYQEFQALLPDATKQQTLDRIARERAMSNTALTSLAGSKTANNLADMAAADASSAVKSALRGDKLGFALNALGYLNDARKGLNNETRSQVARLLFEQRPEQFSAMMEKIAAQQARERNAYQLIGSSLTGAGLAAKH